MASDKTYRWIQMWGIQDDEPMYVGETCLVTNAKGETKQVMVTTAFEYETKAGKTKYRALVTDV